MKIAAAQISVNDENTGANIAKHIHWSQEAAQRGAELIVFPEMSLTGYHIERANEFRFTADDERLKPLQETADENQIHIAAGAPIEINGVLYIGMFILRPKQSPLIYTKQYLHDGEEKAFSGSFAFNPVLEIHNDRIAFAICADVSQAKHAEDAAKSGASIYVAGIFCTPGGIAKDHANLSKYAREHQFNVVMSNYVGSSYKFNAAGLSAHWNADGALLAQLNETEEGLLIADIGSMNN